MSEACQACRPEKIERFLHGQLSERECDELEQHLSTCEGCDEMLTQQTAEEEFWRDAQMMLSDQRDRSQSRFASECSPGTIDSLDSFDQWLDPTDDPRMLGRFGGYEIAGVIGRGGMGIVLKGLDVSLDRYVAIKVLNPLFSSSSAARRRFAREAQAAAAVVHENVIAIHGVDTWNELPYLVMPYIKGESLQQRIDRTAPLSIESTLEISLQIARGLSAAHDQGLVHRDIKPANILVPFSVSRVLITDFGLARAADDASVTRTGVIAGTPQYMSPEQARGQTVDQRTDLFSLGGVMYAMACGHPPFRADSTYGILRRITDEPHRRLSELEPSVPKWFDNVVDRLLQKEPGKRFESAKQLGDHLEECLAHVRQPATVVLPSLQSPATSPWRSKFGLRIVSAAMVGLLLLGWMVRIWWPVDLRQADEIVVKQPETIDAVFSWEYDDTALERLESELRNLSQELLQSPWETLEAPTPSP